MTPVKRFWQHAFNLAILALLALAPFCLYFQSGISFFTTHAIAGLMAIKYQTAQCFLSGEYPLWNPLMISGAPFHSGIGILDPFILAFAFFKGADGLIASAYLALVTAGWGMYFYLRKVWRLTFSASMLGAILYFSNPFFAATSHEQPFMAPPVFLPLLFLFYELHLKDRSWRKLLAASLMLSFTFFTGNLESFYFAALYFTIIQSSRILIHCYYSKSAEPFISELRSGILCFVFAFAFMAVDLLPTLEMIPYSGRNANSTILQNLLNGLLLSAASFGALILSDKADYLPQVLTHKKPWVIAGSVFLLFSLRLDWDPLILNLNNNLFQPNVEMIFLRGEEAFSLLQTALSIPKEVLTSWIPERFIFYIQPPIYIFTLSTLLIFVLTGAFTHNRYLRFLSAFTVFMPLYAYTCIPNLNNYIFKLDQIAYPRIMFIFFFLLSIIVAHGYERLVSLRPENEIKKNAAAIKATLALTFFGLLFYLAIIFPQPNLQRMKDALFSFHEIIQSEGTPLKLIMHHAQINMEALRFFAHENRLLYAFGAAKYATVICLLAAVLSRKMIFRLLFIAFISFDVLAAWNFYTFQKHDLRAIQETSSEVQFLKSLSQENRIGTMDDPQITLWNFYAHDRAADVRWNLPFFWNAKTIEGATLNLAPRIFKEFWALEEGNTFTPTMLNKPVSKIYNLMGMDYLFSLFPVNDASLELVAQGSRYLIYKNTKALPRFYFAKSIYAADQASIKGQIINPAWDPLESTLIESEPSESWRISKSLTPSTGVIRVDKNGYNSLELRTESTNAEFLATTEAFHPNWRVWVDGKLEPAVKTNFYFRGVFLTPGSHTVHFRYEPRSFVIGKLISIAALFLFFIAILISIVKKSIRKAPPVHELNS